MSGNVGTPGHCGSVQIDLARDLAIFDSLPREVRDIINYEPICPPFAGEFLRVRQQGMTPGQMREAIARFTLDYILHTREDWNFWRRPDFVPHPQTLDAQAGKLWPQIRRRTGR